MSKAPPPYDDEIDFFELLEMLWDGKWKIIATTFVAVLIAVIYTVVKPNLYEVSTPIKSGKPDVFIQYTTLNEVLESDGFTHSFTADSIFSEFVVELNDYEEILDVVNTSEFVQKSIKDLDDEDKQSALIDFAKAFKLEAATLNDKENWTLSFEWHDDLEGMRLFNNAIQQTLLNTKNHTIDIINELANTIDVRNKLELERLRLKLSAIVENQIDRNKVRIKYLSEQSAIAKELGIESNGLDTNTLLQSQTAISFNLNAFDIPYYLRGSKAIDKEIELIQSRSNLDNLLNAKDYIEIKERISLLEKDLSSSQLRNMSKILENDNPNDWVEFDLVIADVESQKKLMLPLVLSIVLGGVFGVMYVFTSNAIRMRKKSSARA